jgi:hypothetical protein
MRMREALQIKLDSEAVADARHCAVNDRRIGELCREGRAVFYAFINGVYAEGSPDTLAARLAECDSAARE